MAKVSNVASLGMGLALAGTLGLGWGIVRESTIGLVLGAGLLLLGIVLVTGGLRKPEPKLTIPPAHVTFYQQNKRDVPLPPIPTAHAPDPRDELEPMSAEDLEMHRLDVQIREVTRKINKATVMLGTGKLSDEGYKRYVEDLKSEKAVLEAERVRIEMSRD